MRDLDGLTFADKCKHFAQARASACRDMRGASFEDAIRYGYRWFPRLGGENFRPSNGVGYDTREEAIDDAKSIRDQCRSALRALAEQEGRDDE
ncbi:MAG TPA: hypothetical protein VFJ18_12145 [Pararhizobium sp.]|nr:hypothetical protein [Pararhizobium sp.]